MTLEGEMTLRLLTFAFIGIFVIFPCINSLTFLAEKSALHIETKGKGLRVSVKAKIDITLLKVRTNFQTLEDMGGFFKALPYLKEGSTLKTKFGNALEPGLNHLKSSEKLYTHLFSFTEASIEDVPKSSCIFEFNMIDSSTLIEGVKFLEARSLELSGIEAENALKADKDKMESFMSFITAFNSICADWHNQMATIIGELDTLDGLQFPESLKGKLETATCLTGNGHEFEQITVLSTTPIKNGFLAELDVGIPTSVKTMIHLTPIHYDGVRLMGESDKIYFAKEKNTTVIKLLNCTNNLIWINDRTPTCQEIPLPTICQEGLMLDHINKILTSRPFTHSTPQIAIRLMDEGILIQGNDLTVTEDGQAIMDDTPYIIYSDKTIILRSKSHEMVFPSQTSTASTTIVKSRLTASDILSMKNNAYWDDFKASFNIYDYVEWLAIGIELILAPMAMYGMCLGLKNRVTQGKMQLQAQAKRRKRNQKETKALLKGSRV